jgi:hypothetical protein
MKTALTAGVIGIAIGLGAGFTGGLIYTDGSREEGTLPNGGMGNPSDMDTPDDIFKEGDGE